MIGKGNPILIHIMFMLLPLPKDTYAWLGYYSKENLSIWFLITFIARFPHIFIYTFGGEMLVSNQYGIIITGAVIAIIVYVFVVIFLKKRGKSGE